MHYAGLLKGRVKEKDLISVYCLVHYVMSMATAYNEANSDQYIGLSNHDQQLYRSEFLNRIPGGEIL
jgi:hypothetical protein